jgi:fibronectin-binding autotransporter adhesin
MFSLGNFGTSVTPNSSNTYDLGSSVTTWRNAYFAGSLSAASGLSSSNGLTVSGGTASFASNISAIGNVTTAGSLTASNGLTVSGATATFNSNVSATGNIVTAGSLTASNGLTVSGGTVSLPSGAISAATVGNLPASQITSGTFSVGAFGSTNISTSGTLGAGASTLGALTCTTITTGNNNVTVGSGSITSGQHNPTSSATYDLGASGTAWRSAYLSSNLSVGGAITGSNGLNITGTVSLPSSSITNANISGVDAGKITTGTFGVGAFGTNNISTTGTLGAGASTLGAISASTAVLGQSTSLWARRTFGITGGPLYSIPKWWKIATFNQNTYCSGCLTITGLLGNVASPMKFTANIGFHTLVPSWYASLTLDSADGSSDYFASGVFDFALYSKNLFVYAKQNASYLTMSLDVTTCQFEGNYHTVYPSTSYSLAYAATNAQLMAADTSLTSVLSATSFYSLCGNNIRKTKGFASTFGSITANNGLTVSGGTLTLPSGSVAGTSIASLDASKITTGTFGTGDFGANNIATTGNVTASAGTFNGALSIFGTTTIIAPLLTFGDGNDIGKAQDMTGNTTISDIDKTWTNLHLSGNVRLYGSNPGYFMSIDYLNNDTYGYGQWSGGVSRAVISGSDTSATFNVSKPTGAGTFTDMITVTQNGSMGVGTTSPSYKLDVAGSLHASGAVQFDSTLTTGGAITTTGLGTYDIGSSTNKFGNLFVSYIYPTTFVTNLNPVTHNAYDIGVSGGNYWRNAYFGGTVTASTYTGLPRKYWNAVTQGQWGVTAGALYKIASLPSVGDASGGGTVRICGSMGGFVNNQCVTIDCTISSRGAYSVKGSANGYVSGAKTNGADLVTYVETNGRFSVYIKNTGFYVCWDLSVENAGLNVTVNLDTGGGTLKVNNMSLSYGSGPLYMLTPSINVYGGGSINNGTFIINNSQQGTGFGTKLGGLGSYSGLSFKCMGDSIERHLFDTTTGNAVFKGSLSLGQSSVGSSTLDVTGSASVTGAVTCAGLISSSGLGVTSSGTTNISNMTTVFASSLATGNFLLNDFGTAQSANNCGYTGFMNSGGAGSTSNYASFGMYGYTIGTGTFNACGNGDFGLFTSSPTYNLDISGSLRATGSVSFGNITCGSIGTQGNTISSGTIACTGVNPGTTNTSDLGTSSLLWKNAYHTGTHYNSGNAGFTANSTASLTPLAPFHFFGSCDANTNTMILGTPSGGLSSLVWDDLATFKWKMQTNTGNLEFLRYNATGANTNYNSNAFTRQAYFDSTGKLWCNSTRTISDERIKTNIEPISGALEKLTALKGCIFDYKHPEAHHGDSQVSGFLAQEFQSVFPDMVHECQLNDEDMAEIPEGEKPLGISITTGMFAYMIEALKELKAQNEALTVRVAALEAKA